jgi:hypothetical protein
MSNKFECRAGPTPQTRSSPSVCPHCEKIAARLLQAIAQHHSDEEADRIFSRILDEPTPFDPLTQQDLVHRDNARLLEDFDAAMKVNPNKTAFVKSRAAQNKEIFKTYDAARKSGAKFDALLCDDKYGRLPPHSRRGAGSTNPSTLLRHLNKLRKERDATLRTGHSYEEK